MSRSVRLLCFLAAAAAGAAGQDQPPPSGADSIEEPVYVRRFSIGVTLSVPVQNQIAGEKVNQLVSTAPRLEVVSDNTPKGRSTGYGLMAQVVLTPRFALVANPLIRKMQYNSFTVLYEGVDNPNTPQDERRGTNIEEDSRARLIDVPVMVRFFGKDRYEEGHRWFAQLGPNVQLARKVKSSREILHPNQTKSFDDSPVSYRKRALGGTAGFGARFMDEFGISVIPEVRYTRWFSTTFGSVSGRSRRNQIEFLVSLAF